MVNKKEKGQSLMEVIIALAVTSLLAVGLIKIGTTAVKGSRFSQDQSKMVNLSGGKIAAIIDYKNKNPQEFWSGNYYPPGFANPDYNTEGYCIVTSINLVPLPTETPDFANAKMAQINVKVFWDEKGAGTQCHNLNFSHSLNFDTYVTN